MRASILIAATAAILAAPEQGAAMPADPTAPILLRSPAARWRILPDGAQEAALLPQGRTLRLAGPIAPALRFSAALDRVAEPCERVSGFRTRAVEILAPDRARIDMEASGLALSVFVCLEGGVRRKWCEVTNRSDRERLLLDVTLDDFAPDAAPSAGGAGFPVVVGQDAWAAVEHPAGLNTVAGRRVTLGHSPGVRLAPGATWRSRSALVGLAGEEGARGAFLGWLGSRARRTGKPLSVYTPFGINNQWGACPTLDDEQALAVLDKLAAWQRKGVRFDYFTLDTGWYDPSAPLTRFRATAYPDGPGRVLARVRELGMKPGLWFPVSWGAESCYDYPPAQAGQAPLDIPYRQGYPDRAHEGRMFCLACPPYASMLGDAVLHHIRENGVRFVKFDGGSYECSDPSHGHLPGIYSTERMYDTLIGIADRARALAPDLFVMWYWGIRSPLWALHGDTIFESGLHMEGSGTSAFPTANYRDSVTLAQDQNAAHAGWIPPLVKDSLGVWIANTRWGNFMGRERWREALVMDLGRGSLLFPNLWGNVFELDDGDAAFLAEMCRIIRRDAALFQHRREILGDPFRGEPYGYAHCRGRRGWLFISNPGFSAREAAIPLGPAIGLQAPHGAPLRLAARFPEPACLTGLGGAPLRAGDTLRVWLRPFETLMVEIGGPVRAADAGLAVRAPDGAAARALGVRLAPEPAPMAPRLEARFADAARFEAMGHRREGQAFRAALPAIPVGAPSILVVVVRLRRGGEEWRCTPFAAEYAQVVARDGDEALPLVPMPSPQQYGNTQKAGCSWVTYQIRLGPSRSRHTLSLALHTWLPPGVEAQMEAHVIRRWWRTDPRPTGNGYFADDPS